MTTNFFSSSEIFCFALQRFVTMLLLQEVFSRYIRNRIDHTSKRFSSSSQTHFFHLTDGGGTPSQLKLLVTKHPHCVGSHQLNVRMGERWLTLCSRKHKHKSKRNCKRQKSQRCEGYCFLYVFAVLGVRGVGVRLGGGQCFGAALDFHT